MKNITFSVCLALFIATVCAATSIAQPAAVTVPSGKAILPDGTCGTEEWRDAGRAQIGKEYTLLFKRTSDFVFFCVQPPKEQLFSIDFFLSAASRKLYTFHVSAKLGERELTGDQWQEWTTDWNWWQTTGWTATALRPRDFEKRSFLPHKAIEFQIARSVYSGNRWRVMLKISGGSVIFPTNANDLKRETWLEVKL